MPIKGKESIYSIPPKKETSSQQPPYFKEIMTRITGEDWVGFNNRIKEQQASRGYLLVKGQIKKIRLNSNKLRKNILRAKQAKEFKLEKVELSKFYKSKVISKQYIIKTESSSLI